LATLRRSKVRAAPSARPPTTPPALSSGVAEESQEFSLLVIGTFGVSALLLCLAAVPPAWSRPSRVLRLYARARGGIAAAGLVLLNAAVLAFLFSI
jgi:hypothetical protein